MIEEFSRSLTATLTLAPESGEPAVNSAASLAKHSQASGPATSGGEASEIDSVLLRATPHPCVVLVLGKRGSGKTAFGYRLLELHRYGPRPYVVGLPDSARDLLPDWIGIAPSLDEVPPDAIVLVDEAYVPYHARGSTAQRGRALSQLVNLSRQRGQTIIFVSQEARQIDKNIASSADAVVFKDLGMLQPEFDRPELAKLAVRARDALALVKGDRRRWSFIYASGADFLGPIENELPTFWKAGLSRAFAAAGPPAAARPARSLTAEDKPRRAKELRSRGASYRRIALDLGVSPGTAVNYVRGYPYRQGKSPRE